MKNKENLLINFKEVRALIDLFDSKNAKEIEFIDGTRKLKITRFDYEKIILKLLIAEVPFLIYFRRFLKQWFLYLGFLPGFISVAGVYLFPDSSFEIPFSLSRLIFFFCFFLAGFETWKQERKVNVSRGYSEPIKKEPKINVSSTEKDSHFLLVLSNMGKEHIEDLKVRIFWNQEDGPKEREIKKFLHFGQNPTWNDGEERSFIKVDETLYGSDIPLYSKDGQIKVLIFGKGVDSNNKIEKELFIKNKTKQ